MSDMVGNWLFYPWQKGSNVDFWLHPEDLLKASGIDVGLCVGVFDEYIVLKIVDCLIRVLPCGVKLVLPDPEFSWGDRVFVLNSNQVSCILGVSWHHKDQSYLYSILLSGKKQKRRYLGSDLKSM